MNGGHVAIGTRGLEASTPDWEDVRRRLRGADPALLCAAVRLATRRQDLADVGLQPAAAGATDRIGLPQVVDPYDRDLIVDATVALLASGQNCERPDLGWFHIVLESTLGERVPLAMLPFWWEEFALDELPRQRLLSPRSYTKADEMPVLIIGAGMIGISLAVHLEAAGIPYVVIERNPELGGTWHDNIYPGARVDVGSRGYSFSFEPDYPWTSHYALAGEVKAYLAHCAVKYGVAPHVRYNRTVSGATWDAHSCRWTVNVTTSQGDEETYTSAVLVSAVGLFSQPKRPSYPGIEDFAGEILHTAAWDPSVDLNAKSVGLIGTGSSGVQVAEPLSRQARSLTIFQRSGAWVSHVADYVANVSEDEQWLLDNVPFYLNWLRLAQIYEIGDARKPILNIDPNWTTPGSVSAANAALRENLLAYMVDQVQGDPELIRLCTPAYPPMAKRLPKDNGWFAALTKPHVTLVDDPVVAATPTGVRCASGAEYPLDVLVTATGFTASSFLAELDIHGVAGTLHEAWADDGPRAYLGMVVPGFPNFFCLYGPNQNGTSGAPTAWSEMQSRYIISAIDLMLSSGQRSVDVKREVHAEFNRVLDERLSHLVWSVPGQDSYYTNDKGRIVTNGPWLNSEYWEWTRGLVPSEYNWG